MNRSRQILILFLLVTMVLGPMCSAWIADANTSCTWGISSADVPIPAGRIPVGATLTLHNLTVDSSESDPSLAVYLLNNPSPGVNQFVPGGLSDPFEHDGSIVGTISQPSVSGQDVTIDLGQVNDPQARIWSIFGQPFTQILGDLETVTYSSALLALLDYAGSGRSFGFGLHSQGVTCSGMTLRLVAGSLTESTEPQILTYASNQAPVMTFAPAITITEKDSLSLPITAIDPDGDPVIITAVNLPGAARFDGSEFAWRTFFGDFGTYSIIFTASDGQAEQSRVLTVTVLPAKPIDWYK